MDIKLNNGTLLNVPEGFKFSLERTTYGQWVFFDDNGGIVTFEDDGRSGPKVFVTPKWVTGTELTMQERVDFQRKWHNWVLALDDFVQKHKNELREHTNLAPDVTDYWATYPIYPDNYNPEAEVGGTQHPSSGGLNLLCDLLSANNVANNG